MKGLKKFIEENWNLEIKKITEEPSGEASDTYVIKTNKGKFVVKVVKTNTKFGKKIARNLKKSLKICYELNTSEGIEEISIPVKSKNKNIVEMFGKRPFYLIQFIEGRYGEENWNLNKRQSFNFGKLIGRIHKATKKIIHLNPPKENLAQSYYERQLKKNVDKILLENTSTKKLLESVKGEIDYVLRELSIERNKLKSKTNLVICQRDLIGENLIVNRERVFIIDWDGLGLDLKEKDLWFHVFNKSFLRGYGEGFGKFKLDSSALVFYCCDRLLDDLNEYLEKYLSGNLKDKKRAAEQIRDYLVVDLKKIRLRIGKFRRLK
jgi:Ser/Thr protein kinase RdoA (MazF antagonist)